MNKHDLAELFQPIFNDEASVYLLTKTLYLKTEDLDPNLYDVYEWELDDTWFLISYKIYGTINLWWLICKMNDIQEPIKEIETGTRIKILKENYLEIILESIKKQKEEPNEWQLGF